MSAEKRKLKPDPDGPSKKINTGEHYFEVQPEVENFQREALWRSLQDYKRRAASSQEQLEKLQKTCKWHDDHVKAVDAWWCGLVVHIKVALGQALPGSDGAKTESQRSSLLQSLTRALPELEMHMADRHHIDLKELDGLLARLESKTLLSASEEEIRLSLAEMSTRLHATQLELEHVRLQQSEGATRSHALEEKLASSQRKVDRQKSITLARIEASARKSGNDDSGPVTQNDADVTPDPASTTATREQIQAMHDLQHRNRDMSLRLAEQQQRLVELESSKQALTDSLAHLDTDAVKSAAPFVALRLANEQLRAMCEAQETSLLAQSEELAVLRGDRESFKSGVVEEHEARVAELERRLVQTEQDLARIRATRDELHALLAQRKSQDENKLEATRELGELADTQAIRIEALEAENDRLRPGDSAAAGNHADDENQKLKNELAIMERAFKQANDQGSRKIMDLANMEERIGRLQAEKAKADQKYFAAMKAKDQLLSEFRVIKSQAQKSTEIIQRLGEAEETTRQKIQSLERRIALDEKMLSSMRLETYKLQESLSTTRGALEQKSALVDELQSRAQSQLAEIERLRQTDQQLSDQMTRLQGELDRLRTNEQGRATPNGDSDQLQAYRGMALCSVCSLRWKDTVITSCGHVFCRDCVDKRVETRQRRCPSCNKAFGTGDILAVHL